MRGRTSNSGRRRLLVAAAAAVLASTTSSHGALAQEAQNAGTWSLPPGAGQSTPTPQGPVDAQNPSLRPNREAAPTPAPSTPSTPVPVIVAPPPPPAANTTNQHPRAEPSSRSSAAVEQTAAPATAPASSTAPELQPSAAAPSVSTPAPPAAAAEAPTTGNAFAWWWIALPLALVGIAAALWLRRRAPGGEQVWDEDAAAETAPPPPTPEPAPVVGRRQSAPATPLPDTVDIAFEPVSLRLSLVYATLQFRFTFTASTAQSGGQLLGDMIAAHGSLSQEEQLAPSPETLEIIKAVPAGAAGETVTVTGEIRLPLAAVRALERGAGRYMVPLVRLYLLTEDAVPLRRVFTIGTLSTGTALSPIRLDTGPRMVGDLGAREVEAARALPFASPPRRAAG